MPRNSSETTFRYSGFPSPNGTVVPDDVFDVLMPELSEAELRVLLYIIRRTFGFKKNSDTISINQLIGGIKTRDGRVLDRGTGMSRQGVMRGVKGLLEKGVITVRKEVGEDGVNQVNLYSLRFRQGTGAEDGGVVYEVDHGRERRRPPVVNDVDPQQTALQQTARHHSKLRMASANVDKSVEDKAVGRREQTSFVAPLQTLSERTQLSPVGHVAETLPLGEAIAQWQRRRQTEPEATTEPAQEAWRSAGEQGPQERPTPVPRAPRRGRLRSVPQQDETYQVIQAYIADFARELNDKAPLKTSTMRAYNLYKRSSLDQGRFIDQLYAARAIVKERTASIRSRGEDTAAGFPTKNKAAYFFAVLEDLLGLRDGQGTATRSG